MSPGRVCFVWRSGFLETVRRNLRDVLDGAGGGDENEFVEAVARDERLTEQLDPIRASIVDLFELGVTPKENTRVRPVLAERGDAEARGCVAA